MHLAHTSVKIPLRSCQNWYLKSPLCCEEHTNCIQNPSPSLVFAFICSSSTGIHKLQPIISLYEDPCPSPIWKAFWPRLVSIAWQRCVKSASGLRNTLHLEKSWSSPVQTGDLTRVHHYFLSCTPEPCLFRNSLVYALVLLDYLVRNSSHPPSPKTAEALKAGQWCNLRTDYYFITLKFLQVRVLIV